MRLPDLPDLYANLYYLLINRRIQGDTLFFVASSLFFLHGFMHIGQVIILRKYEPALITFVLVVIPYGIILFKSLSRRA